MKTKRKVDSKAIKQFFIDHTEKIVIGVVGLVFLYFTYSAVMLQVNDSYKQSPEVLKQATTDAQNTMNKGSRHKTAEQEEPIPPYDAMIETFKKPIALNIYEMPRPFDKEVIAPPSPRGAPQIAPVEELRALAGRGAMGSKEGGGTAGQRWVVVTGLVPYAKQLAKYKAEFKDAGYQGDHDVPEYVGFLVQRVEVEPGAASAPNWDKATVTVCTAKILSEQLASRSNGTTSEVVDQKYVNLALTSPLPQRATGEWGDEVAHPSRIKAIPLEERTGGQGAGAVGVGGVRPIPYIIRTPPGAAPGVDGVAHVDDLFEKPGNLAGRDDAANKPNDLAAQAPPYYLLRYFDFDVERGKQYAYRVFPMLINPNWYDTIPPSALLEVPARDQRLLHIKLGKDRPDENGKVADWQMDASSWSKSCQSPRMPNDTRILAGRAEPPRTPAPTETTAEINVLRWDKETGANTYTQKAGLLRGKLLNSESARWISNDGRPATTDKLETDSILVDIMGGDALTAGDRGNIHRNSSILVLTDTGDLVFHDEASEAKEWKEETQPTNTSHLDERHGQRFSHPPPRQPAGDLLPGLHGGR